MNIAISTSSFGSSGTESIDKLREHGLNLFFNPYGRKLNEEEIIKHLKEMDGLIAGLEPLNKNVLSRSPKLKAISRVGIGIENIDLDYAKLSDIKVSNTPESPTHSVAELTLSNMLCLSRSILIHNKALHEKKWRKIISNGLKDSKVLLIGYGRIGSKVSEMLIPFKAKVMVSDPYLIKNDMKYNEEFVSLKEGLGQADIISIHVGGSKTIINEKEFKIMKRGVILMNSSRGELIDELAFKQALDSKIISSAWLDVFSVEPYQGELAKYQQVILTPHISTYTKYCRKEMEMAAVNNILVDLGLKN